MTNRLSLLVFLAALSANAAEADHSDRIATGCPVRVETPVDGNLLGAGCKVSVEAPVSGKAALAGGNVHFDGEVGRDAYGAGGRVVVNGAVGRSVRLAGGHVQIGPNATVAGDASLAGGHVLIDAPVDGNASVAAGTLELGPHARIGGKLRYRGDNLEQDPTAQVANGIERVSRHSGHRDFMPFGRSHHGWIWTAGLMLLAGIFAALLPGYSGRMAEELRTRPWMSLLFGFIAFVCIPVAAVMFMLTIIGIPLGILAILGYAALLLVGYVCTSVVTGGLVLGQLKAEVAQNTAWRAGAAVLAMLVLALIGRIPVVGGFVVFAALIVGVGLIVATVFHRPPPAPAV